MLDFICSSLVKDLIATEKNRSSKMADSLREGTLITIGNPLLDISVNADDNLLKKYCLQPNNAVLAEECHKPLYEEIVSKYGPEYIAGGSAQNTARIVQILVKKPNVVIYMGCVGRDKYSEILKEKAQEVGVNVRYQYTDEQPTGTCAVIVTDHGKHRSLCANLAAANHFTVDHVRDPENMKYIKDASYIYVTGFFVTVSIESLLEVAAVCLENDGTFMMNLSAPFICSVYIKEMSEALPYVDLLFGNVEEATELIKSLGWTASNAKEMALKLADFPKHNSKKKRIVVITQGHNPVILAKDGTTRTFEVDLISPEKVVDTNGAGDAFVGGFISQLILGEPLDMCVKCGTWVASQVIQHSGCTIDKDTVFFP